MCVDNMGVDACVCMDLHASCVICIYLVLLVSINQVFLMIISDGLD